MKHREDPVVKAIRERDPAAGVEASQWAKSDDAAAIADRIRAEGGHTLTAAPRPRMTRRVVVVIAVVVIAASVVAATIAVRSGSPKTTGLVGCHQELVGGGSFFAPVEPGVGPVAACREAWPHALGADAPDRLVACVQPEGGMVVFPLPVGLSGNDACSSVGDAVYRPTEGDR